MKLSKKQRSKIAERICAVWLKRRQMKMSMAPKVYVVRRKRGNNWVWGSYYAFGMTYTNEPTIVLHIGPNASRRDMYILLAHEFTHHLHFLLDSRTKWWRIEINRAPHGERFQRLLWTVIPASLWRRASTGRWAIGKSKHRPEFQPGRLAEEMAA